MGSNTFAPKPLTLGNTAPSAPTTAPTVPDPDEVARRQNLPNMPAATPTAPASFTLAGTATPPPTVPLLPTTNAPAPAAVDPLKKVRLAGAPGGN